jgi:pyruvate,orthophosphate dikinase
VQVAVIHAAAKQVFEKTGATAPYQVGTMIEVPRGALRAGDLAKHAQFFSFGTNDLTQMTCGFSRDDAGEPLAPLPLRPRLASCHEQGWEVCLASPAALLLY